MWSTYFAHGKHVVLEQFPHVENMCFLPAYFIFISYFMMFPIMKVFTHQPS